MGILRMLRRRRAREAFGEYLSPEVIEKALRETGVGIRPPEVQHFQFVVALADDTNPQDVPETISKVVGTLIQHRATVQGISLSLVVARWAYRFPRVTPLGHGGNWSKRCFKTVATESELPMESATEPSACLAAMSGGRMAL
jgi:hypothetical protein